MNTDIEKNNVPASNQTDSYITMQQIPGAKKKILFVGNSITKHAPKPSIGWYGDWGMAASCQEKDYVHLVLQGLEPMNSCIVNAAAWETRFWDSEVLNTHFSPVREFQADIVVIRIGENVPLDAPGLDEFFTFYDEMVRFFSPKTDATVLVTDLFWSCEKLDTAISRCAAQRNYRFVSIGDLGECEENKAIGKFSHEGVAIHPGDLGMARIADRILKELKRGR